MKQNIEQNIADFFDRDRQEAEKAVATEKNQMSIDPNCYIAKEIKYQTALLHRILQELKKQGK